jgi:uncharacterized protein (UPF0262 family)
MPNTPPPELNRNRLVAVTLDEASIARGNYEIERERDIAMLDMLDANMFEVVGRDEGPYTLRLGIQDDRLVLMIGAEGGAPVVSHVLSMTTLRRVMKDYFLVCDSYRQAVKTQPPSKIQALDMGRRALHNECSQTLIDRLAGKIALNDDTSRRLFTLICSLHWKG